MNRLSLLHAPRPLICQALLALGLAAGASAATFVVTTAADTLAADGVTSLREAVELANDAPGADVITFSDGSGGTLNFHDATPETITLLLGEIDLCDAVTITGPGAEKLILSGNDAGRVFDVSNAASALSGLTLRNGKAVGGGAVFQDGGTLLVTDCVVRDSDSGTDSGGGLYVNAGTMTLTDCQVRGNKAGDQGGGIAVAAGAALVLTRTAVEANTAAESDGGGIFSTGLAVSLTDCVLRQNGAGGLGGGLRAEAGALTLLRTRVENNAAGITGGGIDLLSAAATLTDCTVSGNNASREGGGVYALNGSLTLVRSTVALNTSDGSGGGIFSQNATVTLTQSHVDANEAATGGGGINSALGKLTLTGSSVDGNKCDPDSDGGGINTFDVEFSLTDSTVNNNRSGEDGGGIYQDKGTAAVTRSTINGNGAAGLAGLGGGVTVKRGALTLTDSSVCQNRGIDGGAGIHSSEVSTVTLQQCTVSENNATGAGSTGGGLYADTGNVSVIHSTLSGNRAGSGGGIYTETVSVALTNSIFADSTGLDVELDGSSLVLNGKTLVKDGIIRADNTVTGTLVTDADHLLKVDPLLAPLGDYGGATPTMALLPGSPARDAAGNSTRTADQRGFPLVGTADPGAYEAGTLDMNFNAFLRETAALPPGATPAQREADFDYDLDGASNRDEWLAGTSLTDPASFFRLTGFTRSGNTLELTYTTAAGRNYFLESSPDLIHWSPLSATVGTGGVQSVTTPVAGPAQFLHILVRP